MKYFIRIQVSTIAITGGFFAAIKSFNENIEWLFLIAVYLLVQGLFMGLLAIRHYKKDE